MLTKLNIFLFFVLAIIIAFSCGVYYSSNVKSALNLEGKITQAAGEKPPLENKEAVTEYKPESTEEPGIEAEPESEAESDLGDESESEEIRNEAVDSENKIITTETRFSEPTDFEYGMNSADGITLTWYVNNLSGKKINYYTVKVSTFNAVGDPSYDQHSGKSTFSLKYVGPIEPDEELGVFNLFTYQGALDSITIDEVDLEYADGTKETVRYDRSTSNNGGLNN
ncbi:MAG: hypothetical protein ACE3L7_07755 [Candidatus Pristimantibacillus sp.]